MTWTVEGSGTQAASINTEHTLVAAATTNSSYRFLVDVSNLANGDTVELRLYTKVLASSALNEVFKGTFSNVQFILVVQSDEIASDQSLKATLKQVAGTGRAFDWKVLREDSAAALTSADRNLIADAILDRDMSVGTDSGSTTVRTVRQALRALRNKMSISGSTMTIAKEDDATASWTANVTTTGGASPVTGIDPAGP